jgi:hypothetical protein
MNMRYTAPVSRYDMEYCDRCGEEEVLLCCDKCGDGVCRGERCCMIFPHYRNTEYVVCIACKEQIEEKLKQIIDLGKLTLLKRKIATNTLKRLPMTSYVKSDTGGENWEEK